MSTPTLRELIDRATPGPYVAETHGNGSFRIHTEAPGMIQFEVCSRNQWHRKAMSHANAQLIGRCSPATLRAVMEALEHMRDAYIKSAERCALTPQQMEKTETWRVITRALALLNGEELP